MSENIDHINDLSMSDLVNAIERLPKGQEVYMSIKAVCQKLDISRSTFERWRKEGRIPGEVHVYGVPRYRDSDIEKMISKQNPQLIGMKQNKVMGDAAAVIATL